MFRLWFHGNMPFVTLWLRVALSDIQFWTCTNSLCLLMELCRARPLFLYPQPLIDSSEMGPDTWIRIADEIEKGHSQYDGFVVVSGTDTMAYCASALSFMLQVRSAADLLYAVVSEHHIYTDAHAQKYH